MQSPATPVTPKEVECKSDSTAVCIINSVDEQQKQRTAASTFTILPPPVQFTIVLACVYAFQILCTMMTSILKWYFETFQVCWKLILEALQVMILAYIDFLGRLVERLTEPPQCVYFCITAAVLLSIAAMIVKMLIPAWGSPKMGGQLSLTAPSPLVEEKGSQLA